MVFLYFLLVRKDTLRGSWDLVTRDIRKVTILLTPVKVLITLVTKSHDPPSRSADHGRSHPHHNHNGDVLGF